MKRAVAWLLILILLAMSGPAQAMMAYNYLTRPTLEGSSISKKWPQTQVWQGFCKGRPPSPEYGFNQVGQRIAGQQIDANGTEKRAYGYNNRRELIASSVDGPRGQHSGIQYALDQNDNITNNNGVGFTSNVADQLTKAGSTALGYNGAGQATTWGDKSLTFSYKDQIKAITGPGLNAQYLYDGNGQRVQKTVNGVVQKFLWNGGSIAKEYRGDGSVRADYQLGVGAKIEGNWQFYLSDIQGSTIGIADDQGKVIAQYSYSDYGVTTQTSGDKNLYQPFLYTHSELDAETGLYHNKARHYAAQYGKFLARDPIANSNLYSYCNGDPLNFSDQGGLAPNNGGGYQTPDGTHTNQDGSNDPATKVPTVIVFVGGSSGGGGGSASAPSPAPGNSGPGLSTWWNQSILSTQGSNARANPGEVYMGAESTGANTVGVLVLVETMTDIPIFRYLTPASAELEDMHLLPKQFRSEFASAGITTLDDYILVMNKARHRLKFGEGIHTVCGGNWNKVWKIWWQGRKGVPTNASHVIAQLRQMMIDFKLGQI